VFTCAVGGVAADAAVIAPTNMDAPSAAASRFRFITSLVLSRKYIVANPPLCFQLFVE
jgi:hypothetical protein